MIVLALVAALSSTQPPAGGVIDPGVTQATIAATICAPGWSARVRPPARITNRLKAQQLPAGADLRLYEEDHIMPLELGGAPRDPANLRPKILAGPGGARAKDVVESRARRLVCSGAITLEAGRAMIAAWVVAHGEN